MKYWTRTMTLVLACLLPATPILQAQDKRAHILIPITVQVVPSMDIGPILLAIDRGFFARRGLNVKLSTSTSATAIVRNTMDESIKFGYIDIAQSLQAIDNGQQIVLIHPMYGHQDKPEADPYKIYVAPDGPFRDPSSLAAANIGTIRAEPLPQWTTRRALENLGVRDFSRMRWTVVGEQSPEQMVRGGTVDALWLRQPDGYHAEQAGLIPVMSVNASSLPGAVGGYTFTSQHYASQYPEVVRQFKLAMIDANLYASRFPSRNREVLSSYFDIDMAVMNKIPLNSATNEMSTHIVRTIAHDMIRFNLIRQEPDYSTLFWK